jgi:hypothetical protein
VYPSRLAETDVLHPGRARTTPPLTHHCRPRQSPTPHHRPAPRSAGTNPAVRTATPLWPPARPPPPAPPNQATTGTARSRPSPRCSSQGTPSTRNRPCWSRSAPDETPRVEMRPAKTTPTAPQSVHWNSAVNGPLQRPASWPVFPSSSFTTRGDAATGRSSTVGAEVIAVPPGRKADRRPGHHHRTARTALGTVA